MRYPSRNCDGLGSIDRNRTASAVLAFLSLIQAIIHDDGQLRRKSTSELRHYGFNVRILRPPTPAAEAGD